MFCSAVITLFIIVLLIVKGICQVVDYDLMEENVLYMISHFTTPEQVSSYLLNMLDNYPEEPDDIKVWRLLVSDYLLCQGLPPLDYHFQLAGQSWKHPTSFLRPEEDEERLRILSELHAANNRNNDDKTHNLYGVLEAKGRMLKDRDDWESFLKDYSIIVKHEFPADPHVLDELEKSMHMN